MENLHKCPERTLMIGDLLVMEIMQELKPMMK